MKRSLFSLPRRLRQRGVSLLESLVAILLLSIALLGIASLQTASMSFSLGNGARAAIASNLSDFAERVRSNPVTTTTAYQLTTTYAAQQTELAGGLTQARDCATLTCTADQLAAFDLIEWRRRLALDMPGSAAYVTGQRNTGYVVTVMWLDKTNVDESKALVTPTACVSPETSAFLTSVAAKTCCPTSAAAPAGTRCTNMAVSP
jgi:type IV pilus assembly protein PilV